MQAPIGICKRLLGTDIYALINNCRTSVEVIQSFAAAGHVKDLRDAPAIEVIKPGGRAFVFPVAPIARRHAAADFAH